MRFLAVFVATGVLFASGRAWGQQSFDLILAGGRVVDGAGNPWYVADVGVRDGRIAAIGSLRDAQTARRIDAQDMVVAPGFIDPHAHARDIGEMPAAENFVRQGITTLIDGNDGGSPFPIGEHLDALQATGTAPNIGLFVGHGTIRRTVMGQDARAPTRAELDSMKTLIGVAMEEGALGLSTGLAYVPGNYATTEEIIELARVAASFGGVYISHMRDEGAGVLESVRETIRIGREAGIPVQISHHKVGGRRQFGQSDQSLDLIRQARVAGVDITFDQYPYTASSTSLGLIFPAWAHAEDRLEQRLVDPRERSRIKEGMLRFIDERFGDDATRIQLSSCAFDSSAAGKTIADLLVEDGTPPSQSAIADKVIELQLSGGCRAIFHSYDDADVERLLQSDYGMVGSDGSLVELGEGSPHPRSHGTYARVLGHYVRDRGTLPLEQAVRKMTSFPAQRLGLHERGILRPGAVADIVVFDPVTIADRATFEDPHQYSVGVQWVLVNGVIVVEQGKMTNARPGVPLRGPGYRPLL